MAAEYDHTDAFRESRFTEADFAGAQFRDCDLSRVKITDSWLVGTSVSGMVDNLLVNDVDVTAFVSAELDNRHPERVQLREVRSAEDYRAMWRTIERMWASGAARVERLPDTARHERVDGEWSFVETTRHLIFATDAWASRTVLDQPMPYHRLGLTQTTYPPADAAGLGLEIDARPSYAEVMAVRADRQAVVRGILERLNDAELERVCPRAPAPGTPTGNAPSAIASRSSWTRNASTTATRCATWPCSSCEQMAVCERRVSQARLCSDDERAGAMLFRRRSSEEGAQSGALEMREQTSNDGRVTGAGHPPDGPPADGAATSRGFGQAEPIAAERLGPGLAAAQPRS